MRMLEHLQQFNPKVVLRPDHHRHPRPRTKGSQAASSLTETTPEGAGEGVGQGKGIEGGGVAVGGDRVAGGDDGASVGSQGSVGSMSSLGGGTASVPVEPTEDLSDDDDDEEGSQRPTVIPGPEWTLVYCGNDCNYACTNLLPEDVVDDEPDGNITVHFVLQTLGLDFPSYERSDMSHTASYSTLSANEMRRLREQRDVVRKRHTRQIGRHLHSSERTHTGHEQDDNSCKSSSSVLSLSSTCVGGDEDQDVEEGANESQPSDKSTSQGIITARVSRRELRGADKERAAITVKIERVQHGFVATGTFDEFI